MKIPVIEGIIARRVLLNFRAEPEAVRRVVPEPLEVVTHNGSAIVGVCLIRLERLRIKGMPALADWPAENMAHRVAIRFPHEGQMRDGVYVWPRPSLRGVGTP